MKKIVILISGSGSNLEAIAKACQTGNISASIELVISNQANVKGLERAKKFHLMSKVIEHQNFNSREEFDQALLEHILPIEPDLVVLAGFMRILSNEFTEAFDGKLINIHPSLLPDYPGLNTHKQAMENGDLMHANGLCYDRKRNLILLSVNFYSEIWAIPHQYDTEVTKTEKGDLAFRFGNPNTFNSSRERIFFNNHHPNIVSLHPESLDNFLIYMNGSKNNQSAVYEFTFPPKFEKDPKDWLQPELIWEFSDVDLFSAKLSGCIRLPNGNTLICEGDFGYWEVTKDKEVVWKYKGDTSFWRGYVYP